MAGTAKWRVEKTGPDWLMDSEGRVIGYKDRRGVSYFLPAGPMAAGFQEGDEPGGFNLAQAAALQGVVAGDGFLVSQCQANAGDQSSRFSDEVLQAAAASKTLVLPAGQINLSGLAGTIAVSGLRLACFNGRAILDAMTSTYVSPFEVTGGEVDLLGIGLRRWVRPLRSSATLTALRMRRCLLQDNRSAVQMLDVSDYPTSFAAQIVLDDCDVIDAPGWELKGGFDVATATNNRLLRVQRRSDIWDASIFSLYGICLGDHDDVPPSMAQELSRRAVVHGNVINGATNLTGTGSVTRGICVTAQEVSIKGNIVGKIQAPANAEACKGMYLKAAYGVVSGNILTDATSSNDCALAIKGKDQAAPINDGLIVESNVLRAKDYDCSAGIVTFGNAVDVTVRANWLYGFKDFGISIGGAPVRNHVIDNHLVGCGGIPIYFACSDITASSCVRNRINGQVQPTTADRSRPSFPYPTSGTYQLAGIRFVAAAGAIKQFNITNQGSGYTINGSPDGSAWVQIQGGSGGSGSQAYATIAGGKLVSVATGAFGSGWTVAPTVIPLTGTDTTIACSGSQAAVTVVLSTGKITDLLVKDNVFRSDMMWLSTNPDATTYECVQVLHADTGSTSVCIDGVDCIDNGTWTPANPFYIVGLSFLGVIFNSGRAKGIRMAGNSASRRLQAWRVNNATNLANQSVIGPRYLLDRAEFDAGMMIPQSLLYVDGLRAHMTISFAKYRTATSSYLGTLLGGQANGAARLVKVTPRYSGALPTAASGSPTIAIGTAANDGSIVAATPIASLASISSPINGSAANEVAAASNDLDIYLTIAGGTLNSTSGWITLDIEWTCLS